ncbi:MAG: 2TM domain-containing protein [Candidatus Nanopelagicales bacterium]
MSDNLRAAAVKRIKAKRDFWRTFGIFVIVWLILTAVWALSGGGYFWPMWAMFGMGIALLFIGFGLMGRPNGRPASRRSTTRCGRWAAEF